LHQIADENNVDLTIITPTAIPGDTRCPLQVGSLLLYMGVAVADPAGFPIKPIEPTPGGDCRPRKPKATKPVLDEAPTRPQVQQPETQAGYLACPIWKLKTRRLAEDHRRQIPEITGLNAALLLV